MKIFVTGNYCTGSSAAYDYLKEFNNVKTPFNRDGYEHTLFYLPNGLFELEDTLFGNSGYIAFDGAIRDFLEISYNVYKYNYKYYGGYKKYIGDEFIKMTNDFINEIAMPFDARTIGKNQKMYFSPLKACGQLVYAVTKKYKIQSWGMAYKEEKGPGYVLKVDHVGFIEAKKKYMARYLELTKSDVENTLYDHLLLPMNFNEINNCPEDSRLIVVDRDPRDMYVLIRNHYMNNPKNGFEKPPFPINNVDDFIASFLQFRRNEKNIKNSKNIMVVKFEDLVLKYDEFARKLRDFCGISEENHTEKFKYLNPAISANNLYLFKDEKDPAIKKIEQELKEYLYDFEKIDFSKVKKEDSEVF